jgi:transcriptional regulator with XRE-family HTH domain
MNIRKENKYTRKALSFLSGFNENTILAYERNMRKPSKEYIKFMSLYFDVREDYINGISEDKKPLNDLYRVFEMYKDIYPQNTKRINELIKEYDIEYYEDERFKIRVAIFFVFIKELNISYLSFERVLNDEALIGYIDDIGDIFPNREISDDGIVISKEFYASVIKKRNQPKEIYIPLDENTKDFNPKYYEIEQIQNKINLKMQELQEDIKDKMKEIKQLQEDLMSKMSD